MDGVAIPATALQGCHRILGRVSKAVVEFELSTGRDLYTECTILKQFRRNQKQETYLVKYKFNFISLPNQDY